MPVILCHFDPAGMNPLFDSGIGKIQLHLMIKRNRRKANLAFQVDTTGVVTHIVLQQIAYPKGKLGRSG